MAHDGGGHFDLRRTHARDRRRREGGNLSAHQPARRARRSDLDDLFGAARDSRHERSRAGNARGPDRGRVRRGRGDAGENSGDGAGEKLRMSAELPAKVERVVPNALSAEGQKTNALKATRST